MVRRDRCLGSGKAGCVGEGLLGHPVDHQLGIVAKLGEVAVQLDCRLDLGRFTTDLHRHAGAARIAQDVASADLSGASGTPSFFLNGRRLHGAYDIETLSNAARLARAKATITPNHG